jgi:hypothetical protein
MVRAHPARFAHLAAKTCYSLRDAVIRPNELAAAADLVRRKADGIPVVLIRGFSWEGDEAATARRLIRPSEQDLFRRGEPPEGEVRV